MDTQETLTQLSTKGLLINNAGFIAVYPLGGLTTLNGGLGTAWQGAPYANSSFDDVCSPALLSHCHETLTHVQIQFTKDMITDISKNLCVDTTRIYATGKSNGGGFVNLLMCTPTVANLFAAFAPISPALYPKTGGFFGNSQGIACNTTKVIPFINCQFRFASSFARLLKRI
jgi:poly(3-hydroxybutyrate) depolymerase